MSVVSHASTSHGKGSISLAPWQVINLVGAPMLALLFARPVVDDLCGWFRSRRDESSET